LSWRNAKTDEESEDMELGSVNEGKENELEREQSGECRERLRSSGGWGKETTVKREDDVDEEVVAKDS